MYYNINIFNKLKKKRKQLLYDIINSSDLSKQNCSCISNGWNLLFLCSAVFVEDVYRQGSSMPRTTYEPGFKK